jgi:peptide/nickel transport system permease protein
VTTYIIRRLIQALFVLILVTFMVFIIMRFLPGDPVLLFVSQDEISTASEEKIDALRAKFGLDKPIPQQYAYWIWGVLHGDLGESIFFGTTVWEEIGSALPITLHLATMTLILGVLLGVTGGIICAVRRGTWIDTVLTVLANIGITAPSFWIGVLMVYLFGLKLGWLPIQGYTSPFADFWMSTKQSIMPIICLLLFPLAGNMRQGRSAMLEVVRQDFIRTAYAKGLTERAVIIKHAVRNGIVPVVTFIGLGIPNLFGGQVLIETVFNIPGMGRLAVDAIFNHDYAIVQGIILLISILVVLSNLLVDLAYSWIDPRIRHQ